VGWRLPGASDWRDQGFLWLNSRAQGGGRPRRNPGKGDEDGRHDEENSMIGKK
jgi:hypothetical protein